jgi:uncharacterized protein (TIGR01777 family)
MLDPMNVAVTGASGFIGRRAMQLLRAQGHTARPVSLRSASGPGQLANLMDGCEAVVHLAGEPVAQRWSAGVKKRILDSRAEGTRTLLAALRDHPPNVLVSASGIGYYGSCGARILTEQSSPNPENGHDFLCKVAAAWEQEALEAEKLGIRVVRLRIGTVMGLGGGALQKMLFPFRMGLGGRLGPGLQWMSWIHIEDLANMILFALRESTLRGVLNATSPHPVTNAEFTRALARAVNRPAVIPVPAFALRFLLGEMSEMLLGSQRAIPEAALRAGFEFQYPEIGAALIQILNE